MDMDIAAWTQLFQSDPLQARAEFQRRLAQIPVSQQAAIWAWLDSGEAWQQPPSAGPLVGVPFAAKDLFHQRGTRTQAGGIIDSRTHHRDGALIAQLRSLGALPVAKTHLHEFAYGLTGENAHFGDVFHPRHPDRTSGGSSSGSAAAVAAGVIPFALGSDTAGSLRVPAAYCGLYAWRDVPGNAWIRDAYPLAPQFDTAGWLTKTPQDLALLWQHLHGAHETTPPHSARGAYLPAATLGVDTSPDILRIIEQSVKQFTDQVIDESATLPAVCRGVGQTYSVLQSTEAYAIHQHQLDAKRSEYSPAIWQRIDRGRRWTARQLDEARLHALRIRAGFRRFFADHDFLITPVTTRPAPLHAAQSAELRDALLQLNTHVSIAGLPAITVPVPLPDDLSVGVQIVFDSPRSPALGWVLDRCKTCFDQSL